jgi:ADP-ribose pyrophosphatase
MYLARDLSFQSQNPDSDEFLDVVRIPLEKALKMVLDGEIKDSKTMIMIMKVALMQGVSQNG